MKGRKPKPAAFMSYARLDDEYGHVTRFCERLSHEVGTCTGEDFLIFQDRKNILWGQNWKERIKESLDEVTFLIPIITPRFFGSSACRDELQRFLEREKELKRDDLILPIYYVDCPLLNDEEKRAGDELAQAIADHQYADADWRDLRFEPFTSPQVGKTLEKLAVQIRDALDRMQASEKTEAPEPDAGVTHLSAREPSHLSLSDIESVIERGGSTRGPFAKTEPPTRVVDQMHHGDHLTITEAIEAANPGDRILVRPGLYYGGLVIDKPLEIIGDGNLDDVVVQAVGMDALLFKTTMGRVVNLTLRQMGGGGYWFGVDIAQGRLELDGCDITSQSLSGVAIHSDADPRLRRNRIHDCEAGGVFVYENGQGVLEDNEIFENAFAGVEIKAGGTPTLRRNRIHDGKAGGVFVGGNGQGVLEDNEIFGNAYSGVEIAEDGNPTLRRNRIHDTNVGVYIHDNGQGVLEDNEIFGNALSGVWIETGGNPTVRRNRINNNGYVAVFASMGGGGTIEDNDLSGNAMGAWSVSADSEPNLRRARNKE
jgi:F-box protein 11